MDELGIEPGEPLRELHTRMLRQDPDLRAGVAVLAAVAAALLVARSHDSPAARAARVAFVIEGSAEPSERNPVYDLPLRGLRRAGQDLGVRTGVIAAPSEAAFDAALAVEAQRSDLVVVGATLFPTTSRPPQADSPTRASC